MSEQQKATKYLDKLEELLDDVERRIAEAETARNAELAKAEDFVKDRAAEITALDKAMKAAFAAARDHIDDLQRDAQKRMDATNVLHFKVESSVSDAIAALHSLRETATQSAASTMNRFDASFARLDSATDTLEAGVGALQLVNSQDLQRTASDRNATEQGYVQLCDSLKVQIEAVKRGLLDGKERTARDSEIASRTMARAQTDEFSALTERASESLLELEGGLDQGMAVLRQIRAAGSSLSGAVSGDARASMQEITNVMHLIGQIRPVLELAKTLT